MEQIRQTESFIYLKENNMTRPDFFKKLIRYMLLLLITIIALALGNKVVTGSNCSSCPGKGICSGETDCNKY
jgi:hypothetical protein